jgi:hypothetical protein
MKIKYTIPKSLLENLADVPQDRPTVLLLRHSVRKKLPEGSIGVEQEITAEGRRIALEFGGYLKSRLRTLQSSPAFRCVQTAEAINIGAGMKIPVSTNTMLGVPGVYIEDGGLAHETWMRPGTNTGELIRKVCMGVKLSGMRDSDEAAWMLVRYMFAIVGEIQGVHVFVSHDALVMPTAARLIGKTFCATPDDMPAFLDGAFFWMNENKISVAYHEHRSKASFL